MGKKIIPSVYRTPYYPYYNTFVKAPFNFKVNTWDLEINNINLEIVKFLTTIDEKFLNFDFKLVYFKENLIIYIQLPNTLNKIKSQVYTKLFTILMSYKKKFIQKYKFKYKLYFEIIYSKIFLNYSTYFWFISIGILKTKYSIKNLFKELYLNFRELNYIDDRLKGFKIKLSGRINGAELAKTELFKIGPLSLHTILNKIQYKSISIKTKFGLLGIKIWVFLLTTNYDKK
uniref:30S ribosomal protein S3 n=1 Tax=Nephromyces sp. ex Molgula occidentalis TaxID=2544991 RepID=A0A5C1H849_9APIC|nr:30S ribosomal protein S3 [Nephromyces sp. ex Molgula occidentalis]